MLNGSHQLVVVVLAPALSDGDRRPLAVAHAIEETWPAEHMIWELRTRPGKNYEYDPIEHREDRDAWLCSLTGEGKIPFVTNESRERSITISGRAEPDAVASGGVAQLSIYGELPAGAAFVAAAQRMLARLAGGLDAYWGMITPEPAHTEIATQVIAATSDDESPPGLPRLLPSFELDGPDVPQRLGWINYWSDVAAARLGFPDVRRDQDWIVRSERVEKGWITRVTDEPLDLRRADHLDALQRAYARFDAVGRARRD